MKSLPLSLLRHAGLAAFLLLAMSGCLDTRIKNLGYTSATVTDVNTDVETFSVTIAYREGTSRVVTLQGVRDLPSAKLSVSCGTNGLSCSCLYYKTTTDTSPIRSASVGLSAGVNSFSCTMPTSATPAQYNYVRLVKNNATLGTGFINIKTSLTITDVIGDLAQNKVRGIYRYNCQRYFFEGEGMGANGERQCPANQRLGIISAPYSYYLYSAREPATAEGPTKEQDASILGQKSSGAVGDPVCLRQFAKVSCNTSPELRYGLFAEAAGPFQVGIEMTTKPEPAANEDVSKLKPVMGYAALPDTAGNCPTGLIKIRPWMAQPQSIIERSINGTNPPSEFLNNGNILNNMMVEESLPAPFLVSRQPNATPCNGTSTDTANPTGNCANATFGGLSIVQSVTYTQLSPVVCAIPSTLLPGVIP